VHFVEPGHHVSGEGGRLAIVHTATGKTVKDLGAFPTVSKKKARRSGVAMKKAETRKGGTSARPVAAPTAAAPPPAASSQAPTTPGPSSPAPITDGWIVYSGWTNGSANPISYFQTRWAVPPAPASDNGQTVFLFNGIQSFGADVFILQPVLQWGTSSAGGGSYWSITNWYVGSDGTALYGPLIQVNPGDVLEGIMTLTGQTGSNFNYLSSFTGFPTADLVVNNVAELTWANETLECYDFAAFSDYPDTALTAFHDIEIRLRTSTTPFTETQATINWQVNNDVTDNGQQCLIVSNDSPGGDVYLYYRNVAQDMYFVNDKSTFGRDEVTDAIAASGGLFANAFYVMLEGYTIDQLADRRHDRAQLDEPGVRDTGRHLCAAAYPLPVQHPVRVVGARRLSERRRSPVAGCAGRDDEHRCRRRKRPGAVRAGRRCQSLLHRHRSVAG
jgi:hypothetical protein